MEDESVTKKYQKSLKRLLYTSTGYIWNGFFGK